MMPNTGFMTFCSMADKYVHIDDAEFMTLYYMRDENMFMDGEGFIV